MVSDKSIDRHKSVGVSVFTIAFYHITQDERSGISDSFLLDVDFVLDDGVDGMVRRKLS
jgi:hypothetical protein